MYFVTKKNERFEQLNQSLKGEPLKSALSAVFLHPGDLIFPSSVHRQNETVDMLTYIISLIKKI